jgi:hypothetical protein
MTFDEATNEIFRLVKKHSIKVTCSNSAVSRVIDSGVGERVYVYTYTDVGSINVYCRDPDNAVATIKAWLGES